jgi:hypothetical protein
MMVLGRLVPENVIGCREPRRSRYRLHSGMMVQTAVGSHRLDEMDGGGFVMVVGRLKSWNRCGKGWFKRVAGLLNP